MDDQEPEVEQNEELQKFLGTTSFGKQSKEANIQKQLDLSKRPTVPQKSTRSPGESLGIAATSDDEDDKAGRQDDDDQDDSDDDDDDDDDDDEDEFPTSHEMIIKTHERAITTVSLDPSGGRLITGSMDCTLKLHDFSSMTPTTIRAFKSVDPSATKHSANHEVHPVHQVLFNPLSASHVLVVTASAQPRVLSRDGDTLAEFAKGDMYLQDMRNTKGHVSEVTSGCWHPTERNLCLTAGTDSTLRIWDINNTRSQKEVVVYKSKAAGSAGKSRVTAVAWNSPLQGGNKLLIAAALDGSLVMWGGDGPFARPAGEIRDAHVAKTWTSGLDISPDGRTLVTRGGDDTVKLWDTRSFKKPVSTRTLTSMSSQYPTSNICYSPVGHYIVTGSETGDLHILNPATLKSELTTPITPGSPLITALWHPKLNQIVTGSANSEVHVLYNPDMSTGGAKSVMSRAPKRRHIDDDPSLTTDIGQGISGDSVVVPGATFASRHPTIGLTASGRSRDPRRPHVPAQTPFGKNNPDEGYVKTQIPLSSLRDEDPREALLKYADKAEKDPMFTNAWRTTQPKTIFAELSDDEDEAADEAPDKKKLKR